MAGSIIGRTACPECGFAKAHVRESERCLYRYCPECSSQYHARTPMQRDLLIKKTQPTLGDAPTPTPTGPEALEVSGAAAVVAPTSAPVKRRGLFG